MQKFNLNELDFLYVGPTNTNDLKHTDDYLKNLELNRAAIKLVENETNLLIQNKTIETNSNFLNNLLDCSTEELRKNLLTYVNNRNEEKQSLYNQYLNKREFYRISLLKRLRFYNKLLRNGETNDNFVEMMNNQMKNCRISLEQLEKQSQINENKAKTFQIVLDWLNKIPKSKFDNVDCAYSIKDNYKEIDKNIEGFVYENGQLNINNLNKSIECLKDSLFFTTNQSMNIMINKSRNSLELSNNYRDRKMFYNSLLKQHMKECEHLIDISHYSKEFFVSYYEAKLNQCIEKLVVDEVEIQIYRTNIEELNEQVKLSKSTIDDSPNLL